MAHKVDARQVRRNAQLGAGHSAPQEVACDSSEVGEVRVRASCDHDEKQGSLTEFKKEKKKPGLKWTWRGAAGFERKRNRLGESKKERGRREISRARVKAKARNGRL